MFLIGSDGRRLHSATDKMSFLLPSILYCLISISVPLLCIYHFESIKALSLAPSCFPYTP